MRTLQRVLCWGAAVLGGGLGAARADDPWVVYEGGAGPGKGKHVVLVSGDEEYRSEEALPQLGRILARHILQTRPNAKIAMFYQNDDAGKDVLRGVKEVLALGHARFRARLE